MKKLMIMFLLLFLTGCATVQPVITAVPWKSCFISVGEWIGDFFADEKTEDVKNED